MVPRIYLAGAIRDNRQDDIAWREQFIEELGGDAVVLNPLGGKTYDPETRIWQMSGIDSNASRIVKHDCWCVDRADIVVANFTSLAEGYPSIGTLIEFGRATARGALIYTIVGENYRGHESPAIFKLHPFLSELSAVVFNSTTECLDFLIRHIQVLNGSDPSFDGAPVAGAASPA